MATRELPRPHPDAQALAVELAEAALSRVAPEELDDLDESADAYFDDPAAALRSEEDTPLGSGISVVMLTPYILSAAASVVPPILGEIFKGIVTDTVKEPLSAGVRRLIKRPAEPPGPLALNGAQTAQVREAVVDHCYRAGLPSSEAALIADATIGSLHVDNKQHEIQRKTGPKNAPPTSRYADDLTRPVAEHARPNRIMGVFPQPAMTTTRAAALPSSTAMRMVMVAMALVVAGLFVGVALQYALDRTWTTQILACLSAHPRDVQAAIVCGGPVQRVRAAAVAAVALVIVTLAAAVVLIAPGIIRRRKRLVPADQRFAPAVHAIARMAVDDGVRPPGVLISPPPRGEPFCLGRPGDYRIALPRKLALTSGSDLFRALVGHELAHLAHRDVALSWMASSMRFVLGPALALPVVVSVLHGDPLLALDVLWRSAVVMAVVLLVVRALLHAREYDADLRAARVGNVGAVLDAALAHRREPKRGWLARYPSAASRRAVLHNPASGAIWSWVDGLVLGFLVALALPIVTLLASAALTGLNIAGGAALVGALVVGPLFGATVGLGLWRERFLAADGGGGSIPRVAVGVLAGAVLGELVSLAGVGTGRPDLLAAVPVALAGTTAMIGGLGALWAANRGWSRRVALPAAGLGALAAAVLLWAAQEAELQVREIGWGLLVTWLTIRGTATLLVLAATAVVLAAAAWWAARAPGHHRPAGPSLRAGVAVGLAVGLCGGLGLVGYRLLAGSPADDADTIARFSAAVLGAGLVGALVMVILGVARGAPGIGLGLLAGPLAKVTTGALYVVLTVVLGDDPAAVAGLMLSTVVPAAFLMTAPAALLGIIALPSARLSIAVVVATRARCLDRLRRLLLDIKHGIAAAPEPIEPKHTEVGHSSSEISEADIKSSQTAVNWHRVVLSGAIGTTLRRQVLELIQGIGITPVNFDDRAQIDATSIASIDEPLGLQDLIIVFVEPGFSHYSTRAWAEILEVAWSTQASVLPVLIDDAAAPTAFQAWPSVSASSGVSNIPRNLRSIINRSVDMPQRQRIHSMRSQLSSRVAEIRSAIEEYDPFQQGGDGGSA